MPLEIPAQDVRLPARATEALADDEPVVVTRYGRRTAALLSEHQFSLVEPLLELLAKGAKVSPELLMSTEDITLMRELDTDREPAEAEAVQIEALIAQQLSD